MKEKKSNWIYATYTRTNILVNIFSEVGQVLREMPWHYSSCTVSR